MERKRKASGLRQSGGVRSRALLQDRAYDQLKNLIQIGEFPPGSFLSERQLAGKLGMSKTPIRSALVRLDLEGFITVSPQQGIVVREPALNEIVDLFDIRAALETFVARSLAERLKPDQAELIRKSLKEQDQAAKSGDIPLLTQLDADFHILLCELLGNKEIERVMGHLREKLHRIIIRVMNNAAGRPKDAVREHTAIAEAILRGKGDQAAEHVMKHLEFGRQFLIRGART